MNERRKEVRDSEVVLTEEERVRLRVQVEYFINEWLLTHGVQRADVPIFVEHLRWLGARRSMVQKIAMTISISIILGIGAIVGTATWEGLKMLLRAKG